MHPKVKNTFQRKHGSFHHEDAVLSKQGEYCKFVYFYRVNPIGAEDLLGIPSKLAWVVSPGIVQIDEK